MFRGCQIVQRQEKFAKTHTPGNAIRMMEQQQVPVDQRPEAWQLQNFRPSRQETKVRLAADCVASLQDFLARPPAHVVLFEDCQVVSPDEVRIMFTFDQATEWLSTHNLPCFSMDFTWKTNIGALLLGAIGPCGLKAWPNGKPHLRFCPVLFLLSHAEDEESHGMLVRKYVQMSTDAGVNLTHGFFDCACYNGARAALEGDETMKHVRLHRCLQHSKENLRLEAKRKDPVSGVTWRCCQELALVRILGPQENGQCCIGLGYHPLMNMSLQGPGNGETPGRHL